MKIRTLRVGPVQTNCYIVYDEEKKDAFVVDPGGEAERILAFVRENALNVGQILLTHSHFDHVLALAAVQAATGAQVYIHALEKDNIERGENPELAAMRLSGLRIEPVQNVNALEGGDKLVLLGKTFTVLHTPGHTPGSVCYDDGETLFSGDTLFALSCGRTDLPGGSERELLSSLRALAQLPGDRRVLPGHERASTLEAERSMNFAIRMALSK